MEIIIHFKELFTTCLYRSFADDLTGC